MTDPRPAVRVVVADDHPLFREGVVRALNSSDQATVVAELSDGRTALAKIQEFRPDVALLDYKMPDLDGLEVLQAITRDGLPTRVVLLSAFDEGSLVYRALAEGAAGYLTKEAGRDEIVAAVIKCARGGEYLPASLASQKQSRSPSLSSPNAGALQMRPTLGGHSRQPMDCHRANGETWASASAIRTDVFHRGAIGSEASYRLVS